MLDVYIYVVLALLLLTGFAVLGITIAILVQNGNCGCGKSSCGRCKRNGDCKDKKCKPNVEVFLTRGAQEMNEFTNTHGFNTTNQLSRNFPVPALGVPGHGNVTNTELDNFVGEQRTHGIPGLHDFVLYNDPCCPEDLSSSLNVPFAMNLTTPALSPGSSPCTDIPFVSALDWIYIATTTNLSHVDMKLTITSPCVTVAGTAVRGCIPKVIGANYYDFYGYPHCVCNFKQVCKGEFTFQVPLVVANSFFPVTEVDFIYCPTQSLTPGATYKYKVEVCSARCAKILNRKRATYYATQTVPAGAATTFATLGGGSKCGQSYLDCNPCKPCVPVCDPCTVCDSNPCDCIEDKKSSRKRHDSSTEASSEESESSASSSN